MRVGALRHARASAAVAEQRIGTLFCAARTVNRDAGRSRLSTANAWHACCFGCLEHERIARIVKTTDMNTFSPELSQWLLGMAEEQASDAGSKRRADDLAELAQEAALEELAERINAARSIV